MKYNWKKTALKASFVLGEVVIAGSLAYITNNGLFLGLAPILEIALDWIKHKN